jgi:3-deoxy-D-arabino-heptulosonate 7-phosphate (DAHP) synthase
MRILELIAHLDLWPLSQAVTRPEGLTTRWNTTVKILDVISVLVSELLETILVVHVKLLITFVLVDSRNATSQLHISYSSGMEIGGKHRSLSLG